MLNDAYHGSQTTEDLVVDAQLDALILGCSFLNFPIDNVLAQVLSLLASELLEVVAGKFALDWAASCRVVLAFESELQFFELLLRHELSRYDRLVSEHFVKMYPISH